MLGVLAGTPEVRSITMSEQSNSESEKCQSVLDQRAEFQFAMAKAGFVAGTQTAYLRASQIHLHRNREP